MTTPVEIVEVGPRDGLQNEPGTIPAARKIALVDALSEAGFARIEAASFVSPRWVPQMASSGEVMAGIVRRPGTAYGALTPNMKGFEAAVAARADWVAVFASASEGFSRANLNASIDETLDRFAEVAEAALDVGLGLRGYVSCVVHCPYDGPVAPSAAARVALRLADMGCTEISLGDTIGRATPPETAAMLDAVLADLPPDRLAGHFHDTSGQALANVEVSLDRGLRVFDASVAGLGGCPYAPGAAGNLATGALARRLDDLGLSHGLDLAALARAETIATSIRARTE